MGFVDQHLLTIEMGGFDGLKVHQADRTFSMGDGTLLDALSLVPEARALMERSQHDLRVARVLAITSLSLDVVSLGLLFPAMLFGSAVLLPVALVALAVSLVVALVALPFSIQAQNEFLEAVSLYNHGLTKPDAWRLPVSDATLAPATGARVASF